MKRFILPLDFIRSNDLKRIIEYSIEQQDQSQTKTVLLHVAIGIVAGIAPVTYLKPSYQDIPPYGLPDLSSIRVGQVISTWAATASLLYLACTSYLETRMQYLAPIELKDICDGLSRKQISKQDWGIGIVSLASAIPLTTPLVKFPLISTGDKKIDVPANIGLVSVILISNSIAHLRPLQVIISDPWYGAPYAAVQYLINKRKQSQMPLKEKREQQLNSLKMIKQNRLKSLFSQTLLTNGEQLIQECIRFQWRPLPGYRFQLTEYFRHVNSLTDDAFIFSLIDFQRKEFSQIILEGTWKQSIYNFSRNALAQIAGILALGESIGYLGDSGFELAKLIHNIPGGWVLAATPIYAFSVLIHNAARAQTLDAVDFLFALIQGKAALSWPLKYGARSFFGLLLIPSLLIVLLNSSSANTMIRSDFGEYCSDSFIEKYIAIFRWGYVWLTALLMINMEKYLFSKTAQYLGSEDSKAIAVFSERLQNTVNIRLPQWKSERFLAWIAVQTPEFREQALNIPEVVYQDLTANYEESKNLRPPRRCVSLCQIVCMIFSCFNLFKKEPSEEESLTDYQPLDEMDEEKGVNIRQLQSAPIQSSWWTACCFWQRNIPENTRPGLNMSNSNQIKR